MSVGNTRAVLQWFVVVSFMIGFGLLLWVDWRIAVGVLMTHWANDTLEHLMKLED